MTKHLQAASTSVTTLSEAVSTYLASIAPDKRRRAGPELSRFARWYGGDRRLWSITPADVERYQQQTTQGRDPHDLQRLRDFFNFAGEHELTELALGTAVRIRRRAARGEAKSKPAAPASSAADRTTGAQTAAEPSAGLQCSVCGETERLRGKRQGEGITITCGACGNRWERDLRPTCRRCGSTDLVPEQRPGVSPAEHGIRSLLGYKLRPGVRTLAEELRDGGYHTPAEVTGPLFPETGLDRGFLHYRRRDRQQYLDSEWGCELHRVLEQRRLPEPWFLFLHISLVSANSGDVGLG